MKKIYLLTATTMALAACNTDADVNYADDPVAANISARISQSALSRAGGVTWDPGDAIGVTMSDRYSNIRYTTAGGDGIFSGTTMYFQNRRESVTMTAYYPYAGSDGTPVATIEATTDAPAQAAGAQPLIDFMYDSKSGVTGLNPNVNFEFAHKMSMLSLIFNTGPGMENFRLESYKIGGLVLKGTFDTGTGECTAADVEAEDLAIGTDTGTAIDKLPSLIIFPQAPTSVTLDIYGTKDGIARHYTCQLNFRDNRISAGNHYEFNIRINSSEMIVSSAAIAGWDPITHDITDAR